MSTNSHTSGQGAVRNLRAMFENKATDLSTSPPSGGRSPAESDVSINSRPVSKVRASFIAVERPNEAGQGQLWGLRKTSDVGTMSQVNGNVANGIIVHETNPKTKIKRSSASSNGDLALSGPTSPVSRVKDSSHSKPSENGGGLGLILKGSAFEPLPSEILTEVKPGAKARPLNPTKATRKAAPPQLKSRGTPGTTTGSSVSHKEAKASQSSPKVSTKLPAVSKTPNAKTPKSPELHKPTPKNLSLPSRLAKEPAEKAPTTSEKSPIIAKKSSRASLTPAATKPSQPEKATTNAPATKSGRVPGTSPTSPKKPTTKPSTQSTRLSTSAAAPATKMTNGVHHPTTSAKPSTLRQDRPAKPIPNAVTASSLAKKTSRASLASQSNGGDHAKPRTSMASKEPDEGFLARMTRPTASSAQKAHEKLQILSPHSPPRGDRRKSVSKAKPRKSAVKPEDHVEQNGGGSVPGPAAGG